MNNSNTFTVRTSPVVFLKYLILLEFPVALIESAIYINVDLLGFYEQFTLLHIIPFNLWIAIGFMVIQLVIVGIAFFGWYGNSYEVTSHKIIHRANIFGAQDIAPLKAITDIQVNQSDIGNRFNFGTLELTLVHQTEKRTMPNLPNPFHYADRLNRLLTPQQIDINRLLQQPIEALITTDEGQYTEFKSSFSWDYRRQSINKALNKSVMKNVVGFMNSTGGAVIIGVADNGEILGLEKDFNNLRKKDPDGFENMFNMVFNKMVGVEYSNYTQVDFAEIDGKTICRVLALPAPEPIYLREGNQEEFYIRTGNSSQPLTLSQAVKYIQQHFK